MDIHRAWLIAKKDLSILRKRKSLLALLFALPLVLSMGLPLLLDYLIIKKSIPTAMVINLLGAFDFLFIIISALVPLYISSYSIIGEKTEKSLEPLLATPAMDKEILLGKNIGIFIPVILIIILGELIFMGFTDILTFGAVGYLFYPNLNFAIILLLASPLACLYGVNFGVLTSSRSSNVQTAYQMGVVSLIPFFVLYVMGEIGIVSLNTNSNILIISAILLIVVIALFYISAATFSRESILLRWK